jgi:uncharacterized repeat protein (TIGR02543 family)
VSWRGASPDTGLYALQWVRVSAAGTYDFREYTMWNVRGTSTAMPNWLAHGATYALRIYAMRADWDGLTHSNQNVTPHSAIVTFTLPSCNQPATTTTVAPTTYSVTYNGNTNSSGSVPVDATAYTSGATVTVAGNTGTLAKTGYIFDGWCTTQPAAGSACSGTSRAAASTFTISSNVTLYAVWQPNCANGGVCVVGDTGPGGGIVFYVHDDADDLFTSTGSDCGAQCRYLEAAPTDIAGTHAWCSDVLSSLSVTATGIGAGMANTNTADGTCTSGAIQQAADYTNNSKTDWHLPSLDELNQLYTQRVTVGGFVSNGYWSSSEYDRTFSWLYYFSAGTEDAFSKTGNYRVRPVRAVAPSCAVGGPCIVGDTGPGGGIVFYVHDDADDLFTSTGSDCGTSCRYLEAAPSDSSTGIALMPSVNTCYPNGSDVGSSSCLLSFSLYSNTEGQAASRTTAALLGQGMANTNKIYDRATTSGGAESSTYGAGLAWAYSNNGKTDWHLPSKQELNELCKYARQQTTGDTSVACSSAGSIRGGFRNHIYWSSSEEIFSGDVNQARQDFNDGDRVARARNNLFRVRVIRALG